MRCNDSKRRLATGLDAGEKWNDMDGARKSTLFASRFSVEYVGGSGMARRKFHPGKWGGSRLEGWHYFLFYHIESCLFARDCVLSLFLQIVSEIRDKAFTRSIVLFSKLFYCYEKFIEENRIGFWLFFWFSFNLPIFVLPYVIKIILFLATVFTIYNRRGYASHFTCIFLYSVILKPWDIEERYVLYTFNKVL